MEVKQIGVLIVVAIGIIVGLILLQSSATNVAQTTTLVTQNNQTITSPVNGSANYILLYGQAISGSALVTNQSNIVSASNYTIASKVVNNVLRLTYVNNDPQWNNTALNVTYTFQPEGYIPESGSRSVASLIVLLAGLAIAVFSMLPVIRERFGY